MLLKMCLCCSLSRVSGTCVVKALNTDRTADCGASSALTLVPSVLHQPTGDADDVLQDGLGQMLQDHVLLDLQLLVHTDGVQDEDGRDGFTVARQEAAELRLQQLFTLFKTGFLQRNATHKSKSGVFTGRHVVTMALG